MSLVTTKDLMLDAQKNHYAIGAFNAENMEMVQAIIAAAEELRAPVIVQTTPGTLKYASPAMFHAMVGVQSDALDHAVHLAGGAGVIRGDAQRQGLHQSDGLCEQDEVQTQQDVLHIGADLDLLSLIHI